ncbi:hypothetical protein RND81_11G030400 [Saponaria officinalis]|uniref:Integrase catalytic domain-containing protein n=1 Tax=Saponaria officinalis TaxID=3572 RepID=A0AAW1HI49_SAPOF
MTTPVDDSLQITSSDLVATKLITNVFDGNGFNGWKRGMLIGLSAKNKLGFIDGSIPKPAASSSTSKAWQRCNDLVFSWILNSLKEEIANSILYCETAKIAWDELEERFGQSNGAQLYGIHKKLCDFSQGNDDITIYFTKFKQIWDEIDAMGMNPNCTCTCTCGASEKQKKFQQNQKVVQFLMGLNDSFCVMRGAILMQNPLPSISVVYNNLLQEERQREIQNASTFQTNSASFYAKNVNNSTAQKNHPVLYQHNSAPLRSQNFQHSNSGTQFRRYNFGQNTDGEIKCNYCKRPGHTIDKCRKLQYNNKRRFAHNATVDENDGLMQAFSSKGEAEEQALCSQFMEFLKQKQHSDTGPTVSNVNFADNSSKPHEFTFCDNTWIVDSGASDHMCSNLKLFSDIETVPKPYSISLPNGHVVTINSMGTVQLTLDKRLTNVLTLWCAPLSSSRQGCKQSRVQGLVGDRPQALDKGLGSRGSCVANPSHDYRERHTKSKFVSNTSCPHTPQQNGVVERKHKHLLETARALMFQPNLPKKYWGECVLTATYTVNRLPTKILSFKSPYELLFGTSPDLHHMKTFGCLSYASSPKLGRDKFQPRAIPSIFLGYPYGKKAYKLLNLENHSVYTSQDVVFHEHIFPYVKDTHNHSLPNLGHPCFFPEPAPTTQPGPPNHITSAQPTSSPPHHPAQPSPNPTPPIKHSS